MRGISALVAVVALASCGQTPMSKAEEASDIADVAQANARTALGKNEEQDGELEDQSGRIDSLESLVREQSAQIEYLVQERNRLDKNQDTLFDNDQKLQDAINSRRY